MTYLLSLNLGGGECLHLPPGGPPRLIGGGDLRGGLGAGLGGNTV